MAGTVRSRPRQNILNSDGNRHPVQNALTVFTLVTGLAAFVLGMILRNVHHLVPAVHVIASALGLAAMLVGLYTQMVSSNRNQRVLIVAGIIAGFVGLALGLSKGGFLG